jgi:hypothetical protein
MMLFDQMCEEFGVEKSLRIVEYDTTIKSVVPKKKEWFIGGGFTNRCKEIFNNLHWDNTDVDEIARLHAVSYTHLTLPTILRV